MRALPDLVARRLDGVPEGVAQQRVGPESMAVASSEGTSVRRPPGPVASPVISRHASASPLMRRAQTSGDRNDQTDHAWAVHPRYREEVAPTKHHGYGDRPDQPTCPCCHLDG